MQMRSKSPPREDPRYVTLKRAAYLQRQRLLAVQKARKPDLYYFAAQQRYRIVEEARLMRRMEQSHDEAS